MAATVPLCVRQGSKRNDDSVSVEELDWSAVSQVLIPAEHLCVTLHANLEPKMHHQTPMTYSFIIWKKLMLHPLEEKKALPNCGNKDGNIIHILKNCISTSIATVLKCMK